MSKVKLLWKAPSVALAQRGPRVLEFLNREGKTEFFSPEMDADGHILYEVSEEYGRRLLAGQADRFFLVSPQKLVVKKRRKDNMGAEYITVTAITGMKAPAQSAPAGDAQGPDGTPASAQVPDADDKAALGLGSGHTADSAADAGVAPAQTGKHKAPKPTAN